MQEMVNWPGTFDEYRDSGEGGLFAWMIVPEYIGDAERYAGDNAYCHVDVSAYLSRPRVMMRSPDVCVSDAGRKVFEPYQHQNSWFDQSKKLDRMVRDCLGDDQGQDLRRGLIQSLGSDDISVPMRAAVFLGSTSHSLWSARQSRYFEVTKNDLTMDGKEVYNAWQRVFGVDPIILTFLDT